MSADVKGWCPGALRPMLSGDGLIVRLRVSCGELSPALAARIAGWSQRYGNGLIDLSSRGNLQIRGVSEATRGALLAELAAHALVDGSVEAEAVRNVLVSPFAGCFPGVFDVRPATRVLEAALTNDPAFWRLPGKFGFSFDAGPLPLDDALADAAFEADDHGAFFLRVAGAREFRLGPFDEAQVVRIARDLVGLFLDARDGRTPPRRLRDRVIADGAKVLAAKLGLRIFYAPAPALQMSDVLGLHAGFVGLGLPFGRLRAADLAALAKTLSEAQSLRLTPWRVLLVLGASQAPGLDGFILDADDPKLAIAACPGAPECASASIATREIALDLARFVKPRAARPALHVSGCAKGCAHPRPAPVTIVGVDGRYNLVRNGAADGEAEILGLDREALMREMSRF